MASPARFLFDTDFAAPPPPPAVVEPPVPVIEMPVHEALVRDAEREAYERGMNDGRNAAEAHAARRLVDEASRLASAAQSMLAVLDVERERVEREAMRLAEIVGRKLAGHLVDLYPRDVILTVVSDALAPLRRAPHLVVRLAVQDVEPIREALVTIAHDRGFEGRIVVLGEPSIPRGDCRIEWADGGIVIDRAVTEAAIERALNLHITPPVDGSDTGGSS
jgi:flagellar assembly protein FliH